MEPALSKTLEFCDPDGFPQFVATVVESDRYSVEFSVKEVEGFEDGDKDKPIIPDEIYLRATIKWDGCSHVNFGTDGYVHICGARAWQRHCRLMEWLYRLAPNYVEAFDKDEVWE